MPNLTHDEQVCDFLVQTAMVLRQNNLVYDLPYFNLPRILPLRRFAWIEQLNRILYLLFFQVYLMLKHRRSQNFYWWIFFPQLSLISKVKLPGWKLIFDIVDYHSHPTMREQQRLEKHKDILLKKADYLFSISHTLKKLYQSRASRKIIVVPQGCAVQELAIGASTQLKLSTSKPIIGFVGQISERIDLQLLDEVISTNSQWNFVFVGPTHHEPNVATVAKQSLFSQITKHQNVFHYANQKRSALLSLMKQFNICIIPYDVKYDFNRYCYPMKLFEYFYAGKPVVSTPIEELKQFTELVEIAGSGADFTLAIKKMLNKKWTRAHAEKQLQLTIENSWERKIEQISKNL